MCPRTAIYESSCYYICVLILLYLCAHSQVRAIPLTRSALDLSAILDYTLKEHAKCRLRLLQRCLELERAAGCSFYLLY
jgi:hypothetical protein